MIIAHRQFTVSCVCCIYWRFLYVPILALLHTQTQYVQARTQWKRNPVRDCLKRIRMLLFKDMTSAHSNCFSGQKVEHKAKTGVSEWTDLLEEGTGYKINL